jgi:hypothetical protein
MPETAPRAPSPLAAPAVASPLAAAASSVPASSVPASSVPASPVPASPVPASLPAAANRTSPAPVAAQSDGKVSVVPGIARYHTTDCILIRFLSNEDLETMTQQAAERIGCVPCRACRPERSGASV